MPGIAIPEPWLSKIIAHKCDKLKISVRKVKFTYINYKHMVVDPEALIVEPLMEILHYMTDNYEEISPETLNYLRTMFNVYIREDSFTGSRKSGNFNVICDACCNDMNAAELLDRNRTKVKKYMSELEDAYHDIQSNEEVTGRQKMCFHDTHYEKATSAMHECRIHMLIVKGSGVDRNNPVFQTWKQLWRKAEQYVEEMVGIKEDQLHQYQEFITNEKMENLKLLETMRVLLLEK